MDVSRRDLLRGGSALAAVALCGCGTPCTVPDLPPGAGAGDMSFGEVRRCGEERVSAARLFPVQLPDEAPSIISDYGTALGANFGFRLLPHEGIDIVGIEGVTPVLAAMDGLVMEAHRMPHGSGGKYVTIDHGRGALGDVVTAYAHMSAVLVESGKVVRRGAVIGLVGTTGNSARVPHVHYGVYTGPGFRAEHWHPLAHHVNPHHHWYDGPGRVTLFRPGGHYPFRHGATYPLPGRSDEAHFARLAGVRSA